MLISPQPSPVGGQAAFAYDSDIALGVPEPAADEISRTALVNRLRTHRSEVVLIVAPAGYGKTTAVAQWARRDARSFSWVTIEYDVDAAGLAGLLALAIAADDPEPGFAAMRQGTTAFVRWVGRTMLAAREPGVIVIDGTELLREQAAVVLLATLADHLLPRAQLVLVGRRTPSLSIGRLRAEGRLLELQASDLSVTKRESGALLRALGVDVGDAQLDELHRRTEGWASGLHLCGLALQPLPGKRRRDPLSFDGAHHFVTEYLEQEVLARLDPELAVFAVEASVLDRMTGPMCDKVLNRKDSAACLFELAESQSFVFPLDRERTAFRFHPLFRDALRSRLTQHESVRFEELSDRAASWHVAGGDVPAALRHVRASGDRGRGAELLGTVFPALCAGRAGSVVESLDELGDDQLLSENQPAAVVGSFVQAILGNVAGSQRWTAAAESANDQGPVSDGSRSSAWVSVLNAGLGGDGLEQMRSDATAALGELAGRSPLVPFALLMLGVAQVLADERSAAEVTLTEAATLARPSAPLVASVAFAELSLLEQTDPGGGNWERAEELALMARDAAEELGDEVSVFGTLAYAASARSALRNANWVRAGDDIALTHRLLPRATEAIGWLAVQARVELTRAHLALNDVGAARELVAEIDRLLLARPHLGLESAAHELHARIEALQEMSQTVSALTAAELRLLPLLTTHLTFRQIADHLYVSRNTIKTQSISVYRKLGVSSRTEAIDRAVEIGLLKPEREVMLARRS
jgi:LuxR family maltose regulon positive regulatory protein